MLLSQTEPLFSFLGSSQPSLAVLCSITTTIFYWSSSFLPVAFQSAPPFTSSRVGVGFWAVRMSGCCWLCLYLCVCLCVCFDRPSLFTTREGKWQRLLWLFGSAVRSLSPRVGCVLLPIFVVVSLSLFFNKESNLGGGVQEFHLIA